MNTLPTFEQMIEIVNQTRQIPKPDMRTQTKVRIDFLDSERKTLHSEYATFYGTTWIMDIQIDLEQVLNSYFPLEGTEVYINNYPNSDKSAPHTLYLDCDGKRLAHIVEIAAFSGIDCPRDATNTSNATKLMHIPGTRLYNFIRRNQR